MNAPNVDREQAARDVARVMMALSQARVTGAITPLQASSVALAKMAAAQQSIAQANEPFLADLRLMGAKP